MRTALALVVLLGLGLLLWWALGERGSAAGDGGAGADGAAALASEAERLHAAEDHERSAEVWGRAAELAASAGDLESFHAYRAQRGVCLKMLGRADEARADLLPALDYARKHGVERIEGLALGNMARVAGLEGDLDEQQSWYDQLEVFAERLGDTRLLVHTLEQSGTLALRRGDVPGALARLERALALDPGLDSADRRGDALLRQKAVTLVAAGDDEGARALWVGSAPVAAGRANEAQQLALLGRHGEAAEIALDAARLFESEGEARRGERDRALRLFLSELLHAGELDACEDRLAALLIQSDDAATLAPWRVIEARLALARRQAPAAVELLRLGREQQAEEAAVESGWLLAAALHLAARSDEALSLLAELPASLAVDLLVAWIRDAHPPATGLASDGLLRLDPALDFSADGSVQRLRQILPEPLPTLAFTSLHVALADADRLRADGDERLSRQCVQDGLQRALRWQALEARAAVLGRWPAPDALAADASTATAWVAGELPPDEAIVVVLPGRRVSYLVLCTAELGGTTYGLAAESVLATRVADVVRALHDPSPQLAADASARLFESLFAERARADLAGMTRWTLVLPDLLTPVPPPMWVTEAPVPGAPAAWLARSIESRLLPHAGAGSGAVRPAGGPWVQIGEPLLAPERSLLAVPELTARYGTTILVSSALRARSQPPDPRLVGELATSGAIRSQWGRAGTLELSLPALGGGRLGGLLLAPDAPAPFGDERAGFLPWHRLAELAGGGEVILDRSIFLPGEREHGAAYAATAAMAGGASTVLVTRWPLPDGIREGMLNQMDPAQVGLPAGASPPRWSLRLATAMRFYLASAEADGDLRIEHPRLWAAWLLFGGG